jgi:hypothetical protein
MGNNHSMISKALESTAALSVAALKQHHLEAFQHQALAVVTNQASHLPASSLSHDP